MSRHRAVLMKEQPMIARAQDLGSRFNTVADVHFGVIPREDRTNNVLIMFEPRSRNDGPQSKSTEQEIISKKKH